MPWCSCGLACQNVWSYVELCRTPFPDSWNPSRSDRTRSPRLALSPPLLSCCSGLCLAMIAHVRNLVLETHPRSDCNLRLLCCPQRRGELCSGPLGDLALGNNLDGMNLHLQVRRRHSVAATKPLQRCRPGSHNGHVAAFQMCSLCRHGECLASRSARCKFHKLFLHRQMRNQRQVRSVQLESSFLISWL